MTVEFHEVRQFFGLDQEETECHLFLPLFRGPAGLESKPATLPNLRHIPFRYHGHTFADRDAKAAAFITSILSGCGVGLESIHWKEVGAFAPGRPGTVFLFGSRSNEATIWATAAATLGRFVQFDFGRQWSIRGAGAQVFSLPAPTGLSSANYEQQTDYGVLGRFRDPEANTYVFLIAGLGGRATEGCGYFLARHWSDLASRFQSKDFAVVLKFPPPIDARKAEEVVAFDDDHMEGLIPYQMSAHATMTD